MNGTWKLEFHEKKFRTGRFKLCRKAVVYYYVEKQM